MIPPRDVTLAAAAYPIEALPDLGALAAKLDQWVRNAEGADLLVFPEYAGIEAALVAGTATTAAGWCQAAADAADWYREQLLDLAARHGCYILGGSTPARHDGRLVNRAWLAGPDGRAGWQDKQVLTPWERANTPLSPGAPTGGFETPLGHLGVLICYDSEFPLLARALPCDILLVPACTDTTAGDYRVAAGCRARALEGQRLAVHAPLLGAVPHCPLVDDNHGRAGIYAAPDHGWPDSGVIARGARDIPGWTTATIAADAIGQARRHAAVNIPEHWSETEMRQRLAPMRL